MIELVLVRHGETDSNKTHTIQGHLDTPLSTLGELQASKVGERLADQMFHLALSSDLSRAKSTGDAIVTRNSSISSLKTLDVLRERSFGDLEGKPFEAMVEAMKGKNKNELFTWGPPNGETGVMFRERVERFISVLGKEADQLGEKNPVVLVTSHGGFIRDFNLLLVEKYNCKMPCKNGEYGRIAPNTGVSRYQLEYTESGELCTAECTLLYCKDHLEGISTVDPKLYGI